MASSSHVTCLNVGMQTVSMADFLLLPNGGLELERLASSPLIPDPAADATRLGQIKLAVGELKAALGIRGGKVHYSLPSQSVFTRFVKLPAASAEQIDQIIGFEAQQNVPFPIDEVVWDYEIVPSSDPEKMEVVLVATKADQLTMLSEAIEANGLTTGLIDVSPMALYNAFRYNYADRSGCSLLIDIGARTTNLIFAEGESIFCRSIPVGGSSITAALSKEFAKEYGAAEEFKKTKGFVGLGGAYADPDDPAVARMSKIIRNQMTRLHSEISRSISFYRANQGGHQPSAVYLAGGTVALPYMREFFNEKLQATTEFFNPFRNVVISNKVDAEELSLNAHASGDLVGLALRAGGECPIQLNLPPATVVAAQDLSRRKPYLILAALCIAALLGGWWAYLSQASKVKEQVLGQVNREVRQLDQVAEQFDRLAEEQKQLEAIAAPLQLAAVERTVWVEIMDELSEHLPDRFVWITRLTPLINGAPYPFPAAGARQPGPTATTPGGDGDGTARRIDAIELRGLYLADGRKNPQQVIDQFVDNLMKSNVFEISSPDAVIRERITEDGRRWAYGYTLVLPLRNPIAAE